MNSFKVIIVVLCGFLGLAAAICGILYRGELEKSDILRSENLKTAHDSKTELERLKAEAEKERAKNSQEKRNLLEQFSAFSRDKEQAVKELEEAKKRFLEERKFSLTANDDMDKLRREIAVVRKESKENITQFEEAFTKKKQDYETRILALEAQLAKSKQRFTSEADRYHYNLGVVYTQNKDFEPAVKEFKTALGYNPKNAQAHYNLGIIYDDYFKDKQSARYHYRSFLELAPTSEDAEAVREWFAALDK